MRHERRKYERVPMIRDGVLRAIPTGPRARMTTNDLSRGGCGLHTEVGRDPGSLVELRIEIEPAVIEVIRGAVRHQHADIGGTRLGIEFDQLLTRSGHPRLFAYLTEALARATRVHPRDA